MLRAIWTKTLRDYRIAIIGWGAGLGVMMGLTLAYVSTLSEATRAAAAEYAKAMPFIADAVAVQTPEGYATWDSGSILPVMLGIWTALAGARLVRHDEERGALDMLLTSPYSRARLLLEKLAAFLLAVLLISLLIALGCIAGEALGSLEVNVTGALLLGLNTGLTGLVFGMLALLFSQLLTRPAAAAGWAAGFLALSYLLNAAGRIVENGVWLRRLSPLYYYDLNKPLIASYTGKPGAYLILLALSAALAGISLALFARRDIGGVALAAAWNRLRQAPPLARVGAHEGMRAWDTAGRGVFERSAGLRALRAEVGMVFWWLVGVAALIVWLMALTRVAKDAIVRVLEGAPALQLVLGQFDLASDTGYIAAIGFLYLPILFVLFAMTLAIAWAHDVESGRMELALATSQPRGRIFFERLGAVLLGALALPAVSWLVMTVSAGAVGLQVDPARLALAFLGVIPLELLTAAAVFALAGWLRASLVIALVGTLIGASYFADVLSALLKLPDWAVALSIFHQYGAPLTEDPRWLSWLALLTIAAVLAILGALRFSRQDIHQGA
jgi:ABC-2 type transport system permease protein